MSWKIPGTALKRDSRIGGRGPSRRDVSVSEGTPAAPTTKRVKGLIGGACERVRARRRHRTTRSWRAAVETSVLAHENHRNDEIRHRLGSCPNEVGVCGPVRGTSLRILSRVGGGVRPQIRVLVAGRGHERGRPRRASGSWRRCAREWTLSKAFCMLSGALGMGERPWRGARVWPTPRSWTVARHRCTPRASSSMVE